MNILDFIKGNGKCKSASGHWFVLTELVDEWYCIKGYLEMENGFRFKCEWDREGVPRNLPYTHGLNLMPVVSITKYKVVDTKELEKYTSVESFNQEQELKFSA